MKNFRIPLLFAAVFALSAIAAQAAELASAKVLNVKGTVTQRTSNGPEMPLKAGDILTQGVSIRTTELSSAQLVFSNGSMLKVEPTTDITLRELSQQRFSGDRTYEQLAGDPSQSQTLLSLNYGSVSGHARKLQSDSSFDIKTPLGTAAIRGTQFVVTLLYKGTPRQLVLVVENKDGVIDFVTEDGAPPQSVPAGTQIIIELSPDNPSYDAIVNALSNYPPFNPAGRPGPSEDRPGATFTPEDSGVIVISPEDQGN